MVILWKVQLLADRYWASIKI